MWAVGQNCHLAGPSPVSLPRETPFAPTSLLWNMKWGGNHRVGGSHLQILCPPEPMQDWARRSGSPTATTKSHVIKPYP